MNDIVIPVREGEGNPELHYALRSIRKYLPFGKIWIIGYKPSWLTNVRHIPNDFIAGRHDKYQITNRAIAIAAEHPEISEYFWLWNDDFFVLDRYALTMTLKFKGTLHQSIIERKYDNYRDSLDITYRTLKKHMPAHYEWYKLGIKDFEVHMPMLFHKAMLKQITDRYPASDAPYQYRTMYGNIYYNAYPTERVKDVKIYDDETRILRGLVSTTDNSFKHGAQGIFLRKKFNVKSEFEL